MDLGIAGKRAAVAAASKGLGFGVAQALAAEGVRVAICGRDRATRSTTRRAQIGDDAVPIVADVVDRRRRDRLRARRACRARRHRHPRARTRAARRRATSRHTTVDQYLDAFELNCLGAIAMCYEAVPAMRDAAMGEGRGDHVDRGAPTDRHPDPVEHRARRAHRLPAHARARGRGRRRDRELAAAGPARRPNASPRCTAAATNRRAGIPAGRSATPTTSVPFAAFLCSEQAAVRHRNRDPGRRRRVLELAVIRHVSVDVRARGRDEQAAAIIDVLATLPRASADAVVLFGPISR